MNVKKGQRIDIEIDAMAYGGKGIGRLNGLVVFVKGAVPETG